MSFLSLSHLEVSYQPLPSSPFAILPRSHFTNLRYQKEKRWNDFSFPFFFLSLLLLPLPHGPHQLQVKLSAANRCPDTRQRKSPRHPSWWTSSMQSPTNRHVSPRSDA